MTRRELPDVRMPNVTGRMFALSPTAKIVGGVPMIGMAIAAVILDPGISLYTLLLVVFGVSFGPLLLWQGVQDVKERRQHADQMLRAKAEVTEMQRDVCTVEGGKRAIERWLLARGYTNHRVRRWIAAECDIVLPPTSLL